MKVPLANVVASFRDIHSPVPGVPLTPLGIPCGPVTRTSPKGSVAMLGSPPAGGLLSCTGVLNVWAALAVEASPSTVDAASAAASAAESLLLMRIETPFLIPASAPDCSHGRP